MDWHSLYSHRTVKADIVENILGLDIMKKYEFVLDIASESVYAPSKKKSADRAERRF